MNHSASEEVIMDQTESSQTQSREAILYDSDELEQKGKQNNLKVHFIDIGQASATLFQWAEQGEDHAILYDTGDWDKNNVAKYLELQNIEKLDLVVVSHPHAKHIGQLAMIVEEYEVEEVWFSGNISSSKIFERAVEAVMASGAEYDEPRKGETVHYGPIQVETLSPEKLTGQIDEDSIVLRFSYGEIAFLLTGDIHHEQEQAILQNFPDIEADILQLGNHGADTSSDREFLETVNPALAIYSAGENNPYGYPHEDVVATVKDLDIPLYGTDEHGTILIQTNGKSFEVLTKVDGTISPISTTMSISTQKLPKSKFVK